MVLDLFEGKVLEVLNGLREDIKDLTQEVRLLRESQMTTPSTEPKGFIVSVIEKDNSDSLDNVQTHFFCIRLVVLLHYYDMVRQEVKARNISMSGIDKNSVFSFLYRFYNPEDYENFETYGDEAKTTLEQNYDQIEEELKSRLDKNPDLIRALLRGPATKERALVAIKVDMRTSYNDPSIVAFNECARDVLD